MWRFLRLRAHQVATYILPLTLICFVVFGAASTSLAQGALLTFVKTPDNATIGVMQLGVTDIYDSKLVDLMNSISRKVDNIFSVNQKARTQ